MKPNEIKSYASVIREMIRHENEVTNHRFTWFLVIQGVLLTAAASFWDKHWAPFFAVAILGIVTTISTFYSLRLSGQARSHLRDKYNAKLDLYPEEKKEEFPPIAGDIPGSKGWPWANPWILIPWVVVGTWILLLVFQWTIRPFDPEDAQQSGCTFHAAIGATVSCDVGNNGNK
jgi:fatty acid desaturase